MGIIKKENDEAFWLGADVGQTESVSHIPTQITSYKGINAPLNNWEYSFFKGYLLRCGRVQKSNRVCIYSLHRYASVKIGSVYTYVYMQNAKGVDYSCCYLILNSDKKKIDTDGNILPDDDKNVYRQSVLFNLPSGTYYYREIKANMSQMIEEDVSFTVVNSDEEQTIYIDHKPNLYKVYYDSSYTIETPFDDMTPYLNTEFDSKLSIYYYKESNSLSFSYSIAPPTFMRFSYDIKSISFVDSDITGNYDIKWEDGLLSKSVIGSTISLDCGATQTQIETGGSSVYGQENQVIAHYTSVLQTKGIDSSKLKVPSYLTVDYGGNSYKQLLPTYMKLTDARYSCDIQWQEINNVGYSGESFKGYMITSKHISGVSYIEYKDMDVTKYKNRHYGIQTHSYEKSTLREEIEENSVMWSGTHDDKHTITGGEITTTEMEGWGGSSSSELKSLVDTMLKWYSDDIQGGANSSIWYYEDDEGNVEACAYYSSRINNSSNPIISDDAITKSFIGALISRPVVKEGYEDYSF